MNIFKNIVVRLCGSAIGYFFVYYVSEFVPTEQAAFLFYTLASTTFFYGIFFSGLYNQSLKLGIPEKLLEPKYILFALFIFIICLVLDDWYKSLIIIDLSILYLIIMLFSAIFLTSGFVVVSIFTTLLLVRLIMFAQLIIFNQQVTQTFVFLAFVLAILICVILFIVIRPKEITSPSKFDDFLIQNVINFPSIILQSGIISVAGYMLPPTEFIDLVLLHRCWALLNFLLSSIYYDLPNVIRSFPEDFNIDIVQEKVKFYYFCGILCMSGMTILFVINVHFVISLLPFNDEYTLGYFLPVVVAALVNALSGPCGMILRYSRHVDSARNVSVSFLLMALIGVILAIVVPTVTTFTYIFTLLSIGLNLGFFVVLCRKLRVLQ